MKVECRYCNSQISVEGILWVDEFGNGVCEEVEDSHEPKPDEIACDSCGNQMSYRGESEEDKTCDNCQEEYRQVLRDQERDYWHS